jgi:hypothetical protein
MAGLKLIKLNFVVRAFFPSASSLTIMKQFGAAHHSGAPKIFLIILRAHNEAKLIGFLPLN